MIISKQRFQKLLDEEVWKTLQKKEKEEFINRRFAEIGERLCKLEERLDPCRRPANDAATHG